MFWLTSCICSQPLANHEIYAQTWQLTCSRKNAAGQIHTHKCNGTNDKPKQDCQSKESKIGRYNTWHRLSTPMTQVYIHICQPWAHTLHSLAIIQNHFPTWQLQQLHNQKQMLLHHLYKLRPQGPQWQQNSTEVFIYWRRPHNTSTICSTGAAHCWECTQNYLNSTAYTQTLYTSQDNHHPPSNRKEAICPIIS